MIMNKGQSTHSRIKEEGANCTQFSLLESSLRHYQDMKLQRVQHQDIVLENTSVETALHETLASVEKLSKPSNPLLTGALQELESSCCEGNVLRLAEAWNALGLVRLHTESNAKEALHCHKNALNLLKSKREDIPEEDKPNMLIATTLQDLGFCYERLFESSKAISCYHQAKALLKPEGLSESHPRHLAIDRALARLLRI